jgi:hypothetical protein
MAVVIRYFSTSGAGSADGTSWANRAAFVSGGAVNTIVSAFDFTADSLEARIGPGTYTLTSSISSFTGTTAPSANFPCVLQAADSNGDAWVPPNPGWSSAQPVWDDSNMPVIATTTNISAVNNASVAVRGLKFTASGANTSAVSSVLLADWIYVINSTSNTGTHATSPGSGNPVTNSVFKMTGSSYSACAGGTLFRFTNVRLEGNASASSGNMRGVSIALNGATSFVRCTSVNNVGGGIYNTSTGSSVRLSVDNCTIVGTGAASSGVSIASTATVVSVVSNSIVVNNGDYGIDVTGTGRLLSANNRFRDNTDGNTNGMGSIPTTWDIYTTDTDDTEFVDAAGGDYRVKSTAAIWGKGYGAGDEPATGGAASNNRGLMTGGAL